MWRRRLLKNLDYTLLTVVAALLIIGLVTIYSATKSNIAINNGDPYFFVKKQLAAILIGLVGMVIVIFSDYRLSDLTARIFYGFNLVMLFLVRFSPLGHEVSGARSWVNIGSFSFQPSEFAKLIMILTLSKKLSEQESFDTFWSLFRPLPHLCLPLILIMLQPDLGTTLVFVFFYFAMLYMAGAKGRSLLIAVLGGSMLLALLFFSHYYLGTPLPVKEYQLRRLITFINPEYDPLGAGWNINQALIAVGSGQFSGKGLFHNTQGRLGFLPENHTDFIFAVFCEEWGFIGGFTLLGLFFILIWRGLRIAAQAKDKYGTLIATGITAMLTFHVLENVGMNLSIMPITGIPLPFISSGGSSIMVNLLSIGYLQSIWTKRQKIKF